ncbi:MAG: hypothetical protein ACI38Q_07180 [Candidatus Bruticola sp.]
MNRRRNYWRVLQKLVRSDNWEIIWTVLALMVILQLFFSVSTPGNYAQETAVQNDMSIFEDNEFVDNNAEVPVVPGNHFNFERGED